MRRSTTRRMFGFGLASSRPVFRPRLAALEERAVPATFAVTSLADSGTGSLRAAITSANTTSGIDIIDATGVTGTITLLTALPTISGGATIVGKGAGQLTVTRDGAAPAFRIFTVDDGTPTRIPVSFSGMTISGGTSNAGGGLNIASEHITITKCVISGNSSTGMGGGIFSRSDTDLTIIDSTLSGNTATRNGGGLYAGYDGYFLMTGSLVTGNVTGNGVSEGTGGGLYFYGGDAALSHWVVKNSTISGNSAFLTGGGIGVLGYGNTLLVQNSTITGNVAGTGGGIGAAYYVDDITTLESTIVSGNIGAAPDIATAGTLAAKNSAIGEAAGFTLTDNGGNLAFQPFADLKLGALANNGGGTLTHLPAVGSPLINAGFNAIIQGIDQRGFHRTAGSQVDIGAAESGASQPSGNIPLVTTVTAFGATSFSFQVVYTDDTAIKVSTLDTSDLTISGPGGVTITGVKVDVNTDGTPRVATYTITPPGGSWDLADNGTYTVSSVAGQVTDTSSNGITTGIIGQFKVSLQVVTNTNDSGPGSLRQAILDSNATVGFRETIAFAIGSGPVTISPLSPLPLITDPVIIDGATQKGFIGVPLVEIAGNLAGANANGFDIAASDSTIRSLVINRFGTGIRIGGSAKNNTIQGNYIGTNAAGAAAAGNDVGVLLSGTVAGNIVGSNLDGNNDAAERNIISGNKSAGVRTGAVLSPLQVFQWTSGVGANNHYYVVTPPTSWSGGENIAVANGGHLVSITSPEEQGFVASKALPAAFNNMWIGGNDNDVEGTFVWNTGEPFLYTNWNGGEPNNAGGNENLIEMTGGGGWNDNNEGNGARRTTMEFNTAPDIGALSAAFGYLPNLIQGNYVGLNAAGSGAVANAAGVELGGSSSITVRGNVVSGNAGDGVRVSPTPFLTSYQWTTGTGANNHYYLLTPAAKWGDAEAAAITAGGHLVTITSQEEQDFVQSTFLPQLNGQEAWMGFSDAGQAVNDFQWVTGEAVAYTNWGPGEPNNSGDFATFNFQGAGKWDDNGSGAPKPTIMEFTSPPNQSAFDNLFALGGSHVIADNKVGVTASGTVALANGGVGVSISGNATQNVSVTNNTISANGSDGVRVTTTQTLSTVQWTTGTGANNHFYLLSPAATWAAAEAVAIAAGGHLVTITSQEEQDFVQAKFLPLLGVSQAWMGFSDAGQAINDFKWVTGEPTAYTNWGIGEPNNSGDYAIFNFGGNGSWDDYGPNEALLTIMEFNAAPNLDALSANFRTAGKHTITGNTIGGTGALANGGAGVAISGPQSIGISVRSNSIVGNAKLGIDLGAAGITPNDVGDGDYGSNSLQNFPVLSSAKAGATTFVGGSINSTPNTKLNLDLYANATGSQGQRFLGTLAVTTDGSGNASFATNNLGSTAAGEIITATATDPAGSTSEFSTGVAATAAANPPTATIKVNGGAVQRSMVTSLTVTFSEPVNFVTTAATAIILQRLPTSSIPTPNGAVTLAFSPPTGPATTFTITFNDATFAPGVAKSLINGKYSVTLVANQIQSVANGQFLDGDGNTVPGDNQVANFHRLLGDGDGDSDVDNSDFVAFRNAFGAGPSTVFDFDGDNDVDNQDFVAFRNAFGTFP